MALTSAELTILGLLIERPQHGYQLEQVIEERGIRRWADVGFSSIYYVLGRLERRGLVTSRSDGAHRSRRVFAATDTGIAEATTAVSTVLRSGRPAPDSFLVGLANAELLEPADLLEALSLRKAEVDARLADVAAAQRAQAPLPQAARDVFSYSLAMLQAERAWLATRIGTHA